MRGFYVVCIVAAIWLAIYIINRIRYNILPSSTLRNRGAVGETHVSYLLSNLGRKYVLLTDIMLAINGRTTQIDQVVICPAGIFVIETKNYTGHLTGNARSMYLEYRGKQGIYSIYNPAKQNKTHCDAISKVISCPDIPIYSIVAIADTCRMDVDNADVFVPFSKLTRHIKSYKTKVMSRADARILAKLITRNNISSAIERYLHVARIKNNYGEYRQ